MTNSNTQPQNSTQASATTSSLVERETRRRKEGLLKVYQACRAEPFNLEALKEALRSAPNLNSLPYDENGNPVAKENQQSILIYVLQNTPPHPQDKVTIVKELLAIDVFVTKDIINAYKEAGMDEEVITLLENTRTRQFLRDYVVKCRSDLLPEQKRGFYALYDSCLSNFAENKPIDMQAFENTLSALNGVDLDMVQVKENASLRMVNGDLPEDRRQYIIDCVLTQVKNPSDQLTMINKLLAHSPRPRITDSMIQYAQERAKEKAPDSPEAQILKALETARGGASNQSPLLKAIQSGNVEEVKRILSQNPNINLEEISILDGTSPRIEGTVVEWTLLMAPQDKVHEIMTLLLDKNPNLSKRVIDFGANYSGSGHSMFSPRVLGYTQTVWLELKEAIDNSDPKAVQAWIKRYPHFPIEPGTRSYTGDEAGLGEKVDNFDVSAIEYAIAHIQDSAKRNAVVTALLETKVPNQVQENDVIMAMTRANISNNAADVELASLLKSRCEEFSLIDAKTILTSQYERPIGGLMAFYKAMGYQESGARLPNPVIGEENGRAPRDEWDDALLNYHFSCPQVAQNYLRLVCEKYPVGAEGVEADSPEGRRAQYYKELYTLQQYIDGVEGVTPPEGIDSAAKARGRMAEILQNMKNDQTVFPEMPKAEQCCLTSLEWVNQQYPHEQSGADKANALRQAINSGESGQILVAVKEADNETIQKVLQEKGLGVRCFTALKKMHGENSDLGKKYAAVARLYKQLDEETDEAKKSNYKKQLGEALKGISKASGLKAEEKKLVTALQGIYNGNEKTGNENTNSGNTRRGRSGGGQGGSTSTPSVTQPETEQVVAQAQSKAEEESTPWYKQEWLWWVLGLALASVLGYFAFRKGGWLNKDDDDKEPVVVNSNTNDNSNSNSNTNTGNESGGTLDNSAQNITSANLNDMTNLSAQYSKTTSGRE